MKDTSQCLNPWTTEDEQAHPHSELEWWCLEAFFTTNDNKKWCLKAVLSHSLSRVTNQRSSVINMTLFDVDNHQIIPFCSRDITRSLQTQTEGPRIAYHDSFIEGSYPTYSMNFKDTDHMINLHLSFQATSMPHWVAQHVTDGWLPMGLGFYRYGFIPKGILSGGITIQNRSYTVQGQGYFEHVWGNFSYSNQRRRLPELKKTMSMYARILAWWLNGRRMSVPSSIMFATENNPFGNDWIWAVFENGWAMFYGNALFWVMKGPAFGSLILSKDGKHYTEFSEISYSYPEVRKAKEQDFIYPVEIEVTAKKGKEHISFKSRMIAEPREWTNRIPEGRHWVSNTICEAPGIIQGWYTDGTTTIPLRGSCKIEPQRQVSIFGHNSLLITFFKPPKELGFCVEIDSHFLRKFISIDFRLVPRIRLSFVKSGSRR